MFRGSKVTTRRASSCVKIHPSYQYVRTVNATTWQAQTTPTSAAQLRSRARPNGHVTPTAHARRQTRSRARTRLPCRRPAMSSVNWPHVASTSAGCRLPRPVGNLPISSTERSYCVTAPIGVSCSLSASRRTADRRR